MKTLHLFLASLVIAPLVALAGMARSERQWVQPVSLATGTFSNPTAQTQVHVLGVVTAPAATRVRVVVSKASLGQASRIRFTSLKDGQRQALDAAQLALWSQTSAGFNGDSVRVEVILPPGEVGVSVQVKEMIAFSPHVQGAKAAESCCGDPEPKTLCGGDDRVASGDNRVGRLSGLCTVWLVSNGGVLTAGHCTIAGFIEVNIPASGADGTLVSSAVQDQFPVVAGSTTLVDGGVGNDWAVFRVGENSLHQSAHQLYGFFRMTREVPNGGAALRVTGCGVDNTPVGSQPNVCGNFDSMGNCTHFGPNAQNKTLQTATGSLAFLTGTALRYFVDTEPANSGSPIIWGGYTIGIHTAGGCGGATGANQGTAFTLAALEDAIAAVPGQALTPIVPRENIRYLDTVRAPSGAENGTVFQPHDTLSEARNATPTGGLISIVAGNYAVPAGGLTFDRAMTVVAPAGAAVLGN